MTALPPRAFDPVRLYLCKMGAAALLTRENVLPDRLGIALGTPQDARVPLVVADGRRGVQMKIAARSFHCHNSARGARRSRAVSPRVRARPR
jgi:hypothetical protein